MQLDQIQLKQGMYTSPFERRAIAVGLSNVELGSKENANKSVTNGMGAKFIWGLSITRDGEKMKRSPKVM